MTIISKTNKKQQIQQFVLLNQLKLTTWRHIHLGNFIKEEQRRWSPFAFGLCRQVSVKMRSFLLCFLIVGLLYGAVRSSVTYPSLLWNPQNPMWVWSFCFTERIILFKDLQMNLHESKVEEGQQKQPELGVYQLHYLYWLMWVTGCDSYNVFALYNHCRNLNSTFKVLIWRISIRNDLCSLILT